MEADPKPRFLGANLTAPNDTLDLDDQAALNLYLSLMEEAKIRAFSINNATNVPNRLPPPLVREYCFLQLRMLCELIALGCLVAHSDIKATQAKSFQKHGRPTRF